MVYLALLTDEETNKNTHLIIGAFDNEKNAYNALTEYSSIKIISKGQCLVVKYYDCDISDKYYIHYMYCNSMGAYDFYIQGIYSELEKVPKYKKRSKFTSYRVIILDANKIYLDKQESMLYQS